MPYSNPTPGNRTYQATLRSVASVDGNPLSINCAFGSEAIDTDDMGAVFQQFIDLIAASGTFTVQSATRARSFHENVTPSP